MNNYFSAFDDCGFWHERTYGKTDEVKSKPY